MAELLGKPHNPLGSETANECCNASARATKPKEQPVIAPMSTSSERLAIPFKLLTEKLRADFDASLCRYELDVLELLHGTDHGKGGKQEFSKAKEAMWLRKSSLVRDRPAPQVGVASPRSASPRMASPRMSSPRMSSPRVSSPRVASPRNGTFPLFPEPCKMFQAGGQAVQEASGALFEGESRGRFSARESACSTEILEPLAEQSPRSAERLRMILKKSVVAAPMDKVVHRMTANIEDVHWSTKLSDFQFNARPLVQKDSRCSTIMTGRACILSRAFILSFTYALDAVLLVWELQLRSTALMEKRPVPNLLAFTAMSSILCLIFWLDLIIGLVMEFPRLDLIFGRTGFRCLQITVLIQNTLAVLGAIAENGAKFTTTFQIIVDRFSFLRVARGLVVLPKLAGPRLRSFLGELHVIIRVLTGTVRPLTWCSLVYFFILVIFGIFFVENSATRMARLPKDAESSKAEEALLKDWGTLHRCVYSLFVSMLGGRSWGELYKSTEELDMSGRIGFIIFIAFTYIALLNTVTAVFIKVAFNRLERDQDFVIHQELDDKREYLVTAKKIFETLDTDCNGTLVVAELVERLQEPEVAAYFGKLGLEAHDVEKLFILMDEDHDGTIDMREFMMGCLRLRGHAKGLAVELIHQDMKFAINAIGTIHGILQRHAVLLKLPMESSAQSRAQSSTQLGSIHQELQVMGDRLHLLRTAVNSEKDALVFKPTVRPGQSCLFMHPIRTSFV